MCLQAQHGHSVLWGTEEPKLSESISTGMRDAYKKPWPFLRADPALIQSGKVALVCPGEFILNPRQVFSICLQHHRWNYKTSGVRDKVRLASLKEGLKGVFSCLCRHT